MFFGTQCKFFEDQWHSDAQESFYALVMLLCSVCCDILQIATSAIVGHYWKLFSQSH